MASAHRDEYCAWIKNALSALGRPAQVQEVYEWIRTNEKVPTSDLTGRTKRGENIFEKEVRFARWQLRREGIVLSAAYGVWALAP